MRGQFKHNRFYLSTDLIENLKVHFLSFLEITECLLNLSTSIQLNDQHFINDCQSHHFNDKKNKEVKIKINFADEKN